MILKTANTSASVCDWRRMCNRRVISCNWQSDFVKWCSFSYSFQKRCIAWRKVTLSFTINHFVYLSFANCLYRLFSKEFVISPRLWRMIELNSVTHQNSFMWFLFTRCSIIRIVCSFHCLVSICPLFMATAIPSLSELPLLRTATTCPDPECPDFSSSSSGFISESSLSSFPLPLAGLAGYCIAGTLKNYYKSYSFRVYCILLFVRFK